MTRSKSKEPSQRQKRIAEEIRQILAQAFTRKDHQDPTLDSVSLSLHDIEVSPDLRHANVYVGTLRRAAQGLCIEDHVLEALKELEPHYTKIVARTLTSKTAPKISFHADKTGSHAARIEQLLGE